MDPISRLAARQLRADAQAVRVEQATVTALAPLAVEGVDGDLELPVLGWYDNPQLGDQVRVLHADGTGLILGATAPSRRPPAVGTVTAFTDGSDSVAVACGGQAFTLLKAKPYVPTVGEQVAILWDPTPSDAGITWTGVALTGIGATPAPVAVTKAVIPQEQTAAAQAVQPQVTRDTTTLSAVQSGTWRGGWRSDTTDVIQGQWGGWGINSGYWWYGGQWAQLSGCRVLGVTIRLRAGTGGSFAATPVHLFPHGARTKTSVQPATSGGNVGNPALADNAVGTFPLPIAPFQAIVDAGQGGICCLSAASSDYTRLIGLGSDPRSGELTIDWERTT